MPAESVYVALPDGYKALQSYSLQEAPGTYQRQSGMYRFISGPATTIQTTNGVAVLLVKANAIDRLSTRSVDIAENRINLAFVGDDGQKISFGRSIQTQQSVLIEEADPQGVNRILIHAMQDGQRILKDVVLGVRIDGQYTYIPIKLK